MIAPAGSLQKLPAEAVPTYERVRAQILAGQARADTLGAIVFHGMWQGLRVLLSCDAAPRPTATMSPPPAAMPASTLDRQLVRLLADMVLATQSQVHHAS